MFPQNQARPDLQWFKDHFLKTLGIDEAAFLNSMSIVQTYATKLDLWMAQMAKIDLVPIMKRLEKFPEKSKEIMVLASSKGWFFGWHESFYEQVVLIEKLAGIEQHDLDAFLSQYYRDNLQTLTDELVTRYPKRAVVIKAAANAHSAFGTDGYFLSIPVFIAQADGLLTEIAGVKSAMMKAPKTKTGELQGEQALREKLDTDQESLDLIYPILMMHDLDFMKSASERDKAAQNSGDSFTALNRHQVMHGESCDYGTEINSLKAFSFLAFVALHLPSILDSADRRTGGPVIK